MITSWESSQVKWTRLGTILLDPLIQQVFASFILCFIIELYAHQSPIQISIED